MENKNVLSHPCRRKDIKPNRFCILVKSCNIHEPQLYDQLISEVKIKLLVQNQRNKDGCYPEVASKSNFNQYLVSNYYVLNTNICFPNCQ